MFRIFAVLAVLAIAPVAHGQLPKPPVLNVALSGNHVASGRTFQVSLTPDKSKWTGATTVQTRFGPMSLFCSVYYKDEITGFKTVANKPGELPPTYRVDVYDTFLRCDMVCQNQVVTPWPYLVPVGAYFGGYLESLPIASKVPLAAGKSPILCTMAGESVVLSNATVPPTPISSLLGVQITE